MSNRHTHTDPACRHYRWPRTRISRWIHDRARGRSCQACLSPKRRHCDWEHCNRKAVEALRFRAMPGHVHVCAKHAALDRAHAVISESTPLVDGCPWSCDGAPTYNAIPTPRTTNPKDENQ